MCFFLQFFRIIRYIFATILGRFLETPYLCTANESNHETTPLIYLQYYMKKLFVMLAAALMLSSCGAKESEKTEAQAPAQPQEVNVCQTVTDVMMSRRSIRRYKDERVSREALDHIMKCGINAPNGQNRQAYEVRVMDDPQLVKELSDALVKDNPKMAERPGFKNAFVGAPCVVFIANDKSYDISPVDVGLLSENIMLSAWSMGIGSCCLGGPVRAIKSSKSAAPMLKRLNFSDGYELLICIALGYPDESPEAKPRKAEKVQYVE